MNTKRTPAFFALALALVACSAASAAQPAADEEAWARAEREFTRFITPRLEALRERHQQPSIREAQYRSGPLEKYLPDYHLHVLTGPYDGSSKIFLVSKEGKIVDLGDGSWSGNENGYRLQAIPAFLKSRKLPVRNAEEAVEAALLLEEIRGSAGYVGFLQLNTAEFTVFDKRFLSQHYGPQTNWKYSAEPRDQGWLVKKEYTGPTAMVQAPPVYRIEVDEQLRLVDVWDDRHR